MLPQSQSQKFQERFHKEYDCYQIDCINPINFLNNIRGQIHKDGLNTSIKQAVFSLWSLLLCNNFRQLSLPKIGQPQHSQMYQHHYPPHLWLQFWQAFHFHIPLMISFPYDVGMHACIYLAFFQKCVELYFSTPDIKVQAHTIHNNNARSTFSQHSITPDFPSSVRCVPYHLHTFPKSRFQEFPKYFHNKHLLQDKLFCYS